MSVTIENVDEIRVSEEPFLPKYVSANKRIRPLYHHPQKKINMKLIMKNKQKQLSNSVLNDIIYKRLLNQKEHENSSAENINKTIEIYE